MEFFGVRILGFNAETLRKVVLSPDTNVLETRFETDTGVLVVTDLMPIFEERPPWLRPERELVRCVSCERGEVTLEVLYDPRPDYGRAKARVKDGGKLGWRLEHGGWMGRRCCRRWGASPGSTWRAR